MFRAIILDLVQLTMVLVQIYVDLVQFLSFSCNSYHFRAIHAKLDRKRTEYGFSRVQFFLLKKENIYNIENFL